MNITRRGALALLSGIPVVTIPSNNRTVTIFLDGFKKEFQEFRSLRKGNEFQFSDDPEHTWIAIDDPSPLSLTDTTLGLMALPKNI